MHPFTFYVAADIAQDIERLRIITEINADFLKDGLGIGLDDLCRLIAENIDRRNVARNEWRAGTATATGPQLTPRITPAAATRTPLCYLRFRHLLFSSPAKLLSLAKRLRRAVFHYPGHRGIR